MGSSESRHGREEASQAERGFEVGCCVLQMRDTVINQLNGGKPGRVPIRRGKTISWIDAPDDVYFFATDNTRSVGVRLHVTCVGSVAMSCVYSGSLFCFCRWSSVSILLFCLLFPLNILCIVFLFWVKFIFLALVEN